MHGSIAGAARWPFDAEAPVRRIAGCVLIAVALLAALLLAILAVKFGATAPPTRSVSQGFDDWHGAGKVRVDPSSGPGVPLADLVYFGAAWQMLSRTADMPPIILGPGYTRPRVERTSDGLFFAGIVDRVDPLGKVTDVVLAFAGAQGVADFLQGSAMARGEVRSEPRYAAKLFERLWVDPRYADARIHVTGHSLGAGYAEFVGTEAVARHGIGAASARMSIVAFGAPNWGFQSAAYHHVDPSALNRLFTAYTALNDPVITNGGTARVGVSNYLPPFDGLTGLASIANVIAAHWPTTYMTALGLPNWLTPAQKLSCIEAVSDKFITGNSFDPAYARGEGFRLVVQGSVGDDRLVGTADADVLAGMRGRDVLVGGGGADRFLYLNPDESGPAIADADEITDFEAGNRIDLSAMDADVTRPGRQGFKLVKGRVFSAPAQVAWWMDGGNTIVAGNVDSDRAPDFHIVLRGRHPALAGNFILHADELDAKLDAYRYGKASILHR